MKRSDTDKQQKMFELVAQWKSSSLSKKEFLKDKGIGYESFKYWVKKHNKFLSLQGSSAYKQEIVQSFIPVQIQERVKQTSPLEIIYPNGVCIKITAVTEPAQIKTLIHLF